MPRNMSFMLTTEQARNNISKAGRAGSVLVDQLFGESLSYTDNLVNVLVAEERAITQLGIKSRILRLVYPGIAPAGVF